MSILIKGLAMPKNCEECNFDAGGYCLAKSLDFLDWCEVNDRPRPTWCPLIELPPHGNLIDRDSVLEILSDKNAAWDGYVKVKAIPTADVKPVINAHWVVTTNREDCRCSACGELISKEEQFVFSYCPYCGAKTESEE